MIRVFPVAAEGSPHYADDFGAPSALGSAHQGIDIFADAGAPIVAVDDGTLRFAEDPKGGHAFYLTAADGAVYYGAHLESYEGTSPRTVQAGEILGYVGQTGNAAGTSPHLHFEVHPSGGRAVDPFRLLSALTPPSVTSSLGAVDQVLPAAPPSDLPKIPPLAGPVPPVPTAPAAPRRGGGLAVFALGVAGATLWGLARAHR
jgi:hypothetical protein